MIRSVALACTLLAAAAAAAADWPQWMGPNRDDVWTETGIVEAFPAGGPKELWRTPIAGGYAGPAVAGGRVYVTDRVPKAGTDPKTLSVPGPGTERVLCLDAKTGKEVWKHEYDCNYTVQYAYGPRCTPTVHAGKVYTLGAMGHLFCLDAATGKEVWKHNLPEKYKAKVAIWGYSGHPLVYKNLLIVPAGGEGSVLVALDKDTGVEKWKALSAKEPGYGPPTLIDLGGTPRLVFWDSDAVSGLNPDTGEVYWSVPLKPSFGMAVMAPRPAPGNRLFAAGNGDVAVLLQLDPADPKKVAEVWRDAKWKAGKDRKEHAVYPINMTPFVDGDTAYGTTQSGPLVAVKLDTGDRLWSTLVPVLGTDEAGPKGAGTATSFLVKNGDRYFIFAETGHLIIAKLSPKGYEEVSRAKLLEQTGLAFGRPVVWSHPAFAEKCVFARNDKEIVCYSLAKE